MSCEGGTKRQTVRALSESRASRPHYQGAATKTGGALLTGHGQGLAEHGARQHTLRQPLEEACAPGILVVVHMKRLGFIACSRGSALLPGYALHSPGER